MAQKFIDDDAGYRQWLAKHPHGFVLNLLRSLNARYLKLHKSSCWTIAREMPARGLWWTKDYIKICAPSSDGISAWVAEEPKLRGATVSECQICLG